MTRSKQLLGVVGFLLIVGVLFSLTFTTVDVDVEVIDDHLFVPTPLPIFSLHPQPAPFTFPSSTPQPKREEQPLINGYNWSINGWREWDDEPVFVPKDWNGIPISINNNLFKDLSLIPDSEQIIDEIQIELSKLGNFDFIGLERIVIQHVDTIGFNGILHAALLNEKRGSQLEFNTTHHFGVIAARLANRPKYAIEVSTEPILRLSALHGAVWELMLGSNLSQPQDLWDFQEKELCFFYPGHETFQWISCIHGFGHGLTYLFDLDHEKANEVCSMTTNKNIPYSCAFGVYMTILQDNPNSYPINSLSPCDVSKYPGACFQMLKAVFSKLENFPNACNEIPSTYYADACAFGFSSEIIGKPIDVIQICSVYIGNENRYNLCVDGYFTRNRAVMSQNSKNIEICNRLEYQSAIDLCLRKYIYSNFWDYIDITNATIYEYDLLEANYDPNEIPKPYWNPNWNRAFNQRNR